LRLESESSDDAFAATAARWLATLSREQRVAALRAVFGRMDADGSGTVDPREFGRLAEEATAAGALPRLFEHLDGRGAADGRLTLDEWVDGVLDASAALSDEAFRGVAARWMANLTRNQRRVWRTVFSRGHARSFVMAMRATGATHALFIRHANADSRQPLGTPLDAPVSSDADPGLSPQGSAQCMMARASWLARLPMRKVLFSAPASCSQETARSLAAETDAAGAGSSSTASVGEPRMCLVPQLAPYGDTPTCECLVAEREASGLRAFLDADGGEAAFGAYAERACKELAIQFRRSGRLAQRRPGSARAVVDQAAITVRAMANLGVRGLLSPRLTSRATRTPARVAPKLLTSPRGGTYIPVFGHAVFISAVAHAVACAAGSPEHSIEALLDMHVGEAEAVLVPLYGTPTQLLRRPP
jgi:broad specificity phosphatase PhoE